MKRIFNFKRPQKHDNTEIAKDYQRQLNKYLDYPENKKRVEGYLEKYWLDKRELNEVWLKIKHTIYNSNFKKLPDPVFREDFDIIIIEGGLVFAKEDLEALQSCMTITGDKYFIILEDYDENNPPHNSGPPLRFKYPANITWEMITDGADISKQVFLRPIRNYFVFGDSGQWGKYTANDYEYPLDFIGFNKQYSDLFHNKIIISPEEISVLKKWVAFYGMKLPGVD